MENVLALDFISQTTKYLITKNNLREIYSKIAKKDFLSLILKIFKQIHVVVCIVEKDFRASRIASFQGRLETFLRNILRYSYENQNVIFADG